MCTGCSVSSVHPWPAGPGAGVVPARNGLGCGEFDGVVTVFGSVPSDQPPKWASFATNVPLIVVRSSKSLQSPPAEMWTSMVGNGAGGPTGPVLSIRIEYHGLLATMLASVCVVATSS